MQKNHGLFLPNPEYLVDLDSFIGYLFTSSIDFTNVYTAGLAK